jgi:glycosyltransferase involved in cell wall biosynthesis
MGEQAFVAIAIPAYNAESTIAETLKSIQQCPEIGDVGGVFVCDDASQDATVARAYESWGGRIPLTILRNKENSGERAVVNRLLRHLCNDYEWVFIIHADDCAKMSWLGLYLKQIEKAGRAVASICSSYDCWYPEDKATVPGEDDWTRDVETIKGSRESVIGTLARGCWWHLSGAAIRVDHFFRIGEFHTELPQLGDFEWLLRCLKKGYDIEYIPRTTILYRMHSTSVSSRSFKNGQDLRERLRITNEYFRYGYLDKQKWRKTRVRVGFAALRRVVKYAAQGEHDPIRQL